MEAVLLVAGCGIHLVFISYSISLYVKNVRGLVFSDVLCVQQLILEDCIYWSATQFWNFVLVRLCFTQLNSRLIVFTGSSIDLPVALI